MDLPSSLEAVTRWLWRPTPQWVRVSLRAPSQAGAATWICEVRVQGAAAASTSASGSGSGRRPLGAYLRALSEAGEDALRRTRGLNSRCGMAGGVFRRQALRRAQAELLEHDAFLYHYRNRIPFRPLWSCEDLQAYELCTASTPVRAALVTRVFYQSVANREFVHFGIGADRDLNAAVQKAVREHDLLLPRLLNAGTHAASTDNARDEHFFAAFDERNIQIFASLCSGLGPVAESQSAPWPRRTLADLPWDHESLLSPVRFFRFVRVRNPALIPMEFGAPEPFTESGGALYHPFF